MKYKKSIPEFIKAMAELVEHKVSGHIVLITDFGDWGKFLIDNGNLYSVSLGDYRGMQVLEYIKPMEHIQYMFRPAKHEENRGGRPPAAGSAAMDNNTFFSYFSHTLPSAIFRQQAQAKTIEATRSPKTAKGTILVVDDSALARKVVCNILIAEGFQIAEAKDGFEAMGQLEIVNPDLVVLDLIMPRIDGYQVVELMKANTVYRNIPIITLTSRDSLMDKLKGKMSATDAYITKPVKQDELLNKISQLLA